MIKTLGKKLCLLLFASITLYAGSIESSVDATEIARGDSVLFSLTVVGEESDPLPELNEIDGMKVEQITRNNGSDFVHVDGKSVMQQTTTVTYEFKPKYNMTIPAFQVMVDGKVEISKAINLKVVDAQAGTKRRNKYFSLDMKVNKQKVYVGEPVVVTVYFRQNKNIKLMELDYKKPEFSNFFSQQLEGETRYKEGIYTVHELKYLLIPKKAGKLTIEAATAKVAQRVQERQEGGWFANVPKWSNIASPSLTLEVLPVPSAYDLGGDFTLTSSIDKKRVKANKPVNMTIELKGEGSLEDFEGIEFDLPNVTVYSDDAKVKSSYKNGKLMSHYIKSFVFIADHDFTIPSKEIHLFNYKTGKIKVLKTDAYSIEIFGAKKEKVKSETVVHTKEALKKEPKEEPVSLEKSAIFQKLEHLSPGALLLSLMFVLGAISSLFILYMFKFFFRRKKTKQQGFTGHEALQILYPHMSDSPDVEYMVRQLYAIKSGEKKIKIDRELLKELLNKYKPKKEL